VECSGGVRYHTPSWTFSLCRNQLGGNRPPRAVRHNVGNRTRGSHDVCTSGARELFDVTGADREALVRFDGLVHLPVDAFPAIEDREPTSRVDWLEAS
jgi:hypothetical protein